MALAFYSPANAAITIFNDQHTDAEGISAGFGDADPSGRAYSCQGFRTTYTSITGFEFDINSVGTAGMLVWLDNAIATSSAPSGTFTVGLGSLEITNAQLSTNRTKYNFASAITVSPGYYTLCFAPWNTTTHVWTADYRDMDSSVSAVYDLGRSVISLDGSVWTAPDSGNMDRDIVIYGEEANGSVIIDSISTSTEAAAAASLTFAHTAVAGTNTGLCVGISVRDASATDINISTVTFNADSLTLVQRDETSAGVQASEIWCMATPDVVTGNVVITPTGTVDFIQAYVLGVSGVDTTDLSAGNNGANSTTATFGTVTVTTDTANCLMMDVIYSDVNITASTGTTTGQRQKAAWTPNTNGDEGNGSTIKTTTTGNYTTSWHWTTVLDANYALSAMCIKPVAVAASVTLGRSLTPIIFFDEDD